MACRKAGTLSVPGVYIGLLDKIPFGALMNKGLTVRTGQTHVQRYLAPLLDKIESGEIDPSFVITHRIPLEEAPDAYEKFRKKTDGCIKVVIKPGMNRAAPLPMADHSAAAHSVQGDSQVASLPALV
jgi:threonine dehydrogenase-like Zn-dependent dehydrogenase